MSKDEFIALTGEDPEKLWGPDWIKFLQAFTEDQMRG